MALWVSDWESATAIRVSQRAPIESIAAIFAAEPRAIPSSMSRRLGLGPGQLEFL